MTAYLTDIVDGLGTARVAVVGDVMLDRFVYGDIERISPEAPVPVVKLDRTEEMLGGAGNVAANVASLGGSALLVGLIGADGAGACVRRLVSGLGGMDRLVESADRPTILKTRITARQQQVVRLDEERVGPPSAREREGLLEAATAALGEADVLLLSDYAKGVLAGDMPTRLIALARAAGRTVIVDPKGRDYARYEGADVVTPNLRELREATGMPCDGDEAVVAAGRTLIARHRLKAVVATRSEQGMTVITADDHVHLPTIAREVFDVSGAGDTVVATLACALARGVALPDAARLANAAAGIVVGKLGTSQVTRDELAAITRRQEMDESDRKIVLRHEAAAVAGRWRRQGLKVGFTNGCFDLLHPGHLSLLRQARGGCDRLVVGINTDESVQRLKGPTRPIQSELARAAVLASLGMVDLVVLFGEDTPMELIDAIRPDVLVKGADYRVDQVVGADLVQSYGGTVLLADLKDGFSTTRTVERIRLVS
ncbi:bifunctional D-glycero-beta-D-manno-heptose-7-phosphate kinase/D-glycero-beta-D-manno-heptose 1-phosphate adenylyltransferase HldE [Azospirillum brasilense]|nr:bifunctional D-glycero-beta-D-manno-heptose-7-phosphate kinase/D-glycero-beta-D-manno-heptose 1-phosphate adenylyltransferase HldE [Azospirillum brasilense]